MSETWEWYNGCSWWRLGIAGDQARHAEVLYPTIDRDGHPNLVCSEETRHLIAAAPDLLAALQFLYDETLSYIEVNNLGAHNNQSMQMARAALAKAHGR